MEKRVPQFSSALKLFTLYVTQTELEYLQNRPEFFAAIVRYLFLKKRIPRLASGFQILRIILEFLSGNELQEGLHDHLTFERVDKIIVKIKLINLNIFRFELYHNLYGILFDFTLIRPSILNEIMNPISARSFVR